MKRVPFFAWMVLIVAVVAYVLTAAPSIYGIHSDTLEFQVIGPTFGIAHPTGYPLYSILGGVWSRVLFPVGNWAWRMNLFSALTGGLTVFVLFLVCEKLISGAGFFPRRRKDARLRPSSAEQKYEEKQQYLGRGVSTTIALTIALSVALLFGMGTIWWSQTTIAEVYSLHALFMVTILYVAVCIPFNKDDTPSLGWLFFLVGLSLAHHRTSVLILPGIAIYLLLTVPDIWKPSPQWVGWLAALLVPLLLYGYIPIRAAMGATDLSGLYVNSWAGFWDHVLARGFNAFFADNELAIQRSFADWVALVQGQIGWTGILLAVIGSGQVFIRNIGPKNDVAPHEEQRAAWLLVLITLIANLIFVLKYRVGDIEVFLLPVLLCAAILAGGGIALIARIGARVDRRASVWIARAALLLLLLPRSYAVAQSWGDLTLGQAWAEHNQAVAIAKVNFLPNSQLIGLEGEISALTYMQRAEGLAQNATGIIARGGDESARVERIRAAVAAGESVYLTREVPGIGSTFSFSGEGPLIRVWPRGSAQVAMPDSARQLSDPLLMDETLRVDGIEIVWLDQPGEASLRITFYWTPLAPITERLKLSLRLRGEDGKPMRGTDGAPIVEDRFPLRQAAYTEEWVVGEQIRDVHYVTVPTDANLANGILWVVLYSAQSGAEVGRLVMPITP